MSFPASSQVMWQSRESCGPPHSPLPVSAAVQLVLFLGKRGRLRAGMEEKPNAAGILGPRRDGSGRRAYGRRWGEEARTVSLSVTGGLRRRRL